MLLQQQMMAPIRIVADEPLLLNYLSFLLFAIAHIGMMNVLMVPLTQYTNAFYTPDIWLWDYSVDTLNAYYDTLGVEGCQYYVQVANWDLFPYMPAYVFLVGPWQVAVARKLGKTNSSGGDAYHLWLRPWVLWIVWTLDFVETLIQRQGCIIYPDRLRDSTIVLASLCQGCKGTLLILSVAQLLVGAAKVSCQQRNEKKQH